MTSYSTRSGTVARALLAFSLLAAVAVILAPTGSATPTNKPFAAVFGSTVGSDGGVTLRITNETRNQMLGSANVTAPAGVTISATDTPSSQLDPTQSFPTSTLMLRNLDLSPGHAYTTTVYVAAPGCTAFTWSIEAHQSNDYNSDSGNALYFDSANSSLATFNPSGCHLAWVHEPASANAAPAVITDTAYTSAPPASLVQVKLVDGAGATVDVSGPTVALTMYAGFDINGNAVSTSPFTGAEAQLSHGVATFGSLESIQDGEFQLQPTSSGLASPDPSAPFDITDSGTSCVGLDPCPLSTTVGGNPLDVTASGGNFLFVAVSTADLPSSVVGPGGGCENFVGTGTGFAVTDGRNGDGTLDITLSIRTNDLKRAYGPNYGQPNVPICAGAKRLDPVDHTPMDCHSDTAGGFADRTLGLDGKFDGGYSTAVCGAGGYWWGILGTFQDPDPPFDSSSIPLITAWGSSPDGVYRTFIVHEPAGWDGHFGA